MSKQVIGRSAAEARARGATPGYKLIRSARAIRNGWHNQLLSELALVQSADLRASSTACFSELNPLRSISLRRECHFLCKETSFVRSPSLLVHSWIRPTSPRNWADSCVK